MGRVRGIDDSAEICPTLTGRKVKPLKGPLLPPKVKRVRFAGGVSEGRIAGNRITSQSSSQGRWGQK